MKNKTTLLLIYIITASLSSVAVNAQVLIMDSFETMDMSATNSDGFAWGSNDRTSIVTQHPDDGNVVVFNGNPIYNIINDSRDWTAFDGGYSLRFRYPAGVPMAEQRFNLGGAYPELWISFWLKIPDNFSYGPTGSPNKFLALWSDDYSQRGVGSTVFLGMHRYQETGATLALTYTLGDKTGSLGYQQYTPFITTSDAGRWMQIVMHFKAETAPGQSDGMIQTFRRWEGNDEFETLHDGSGLPLKLPDDYAGFNKGYILGWANAAYTEDTEWLLDNFTVSETSLLLSNEDLIFANGFDSN